MENKIWARDVKEGEKVKTVFLVARKATPTAKSGKTYLAVTLVDKTGELEARAFDNLEALSPKFEEKEYVEVEGQIGAFQGKPQLRLEAAEKVDAAALQLDAAEFAYTPPPEAARPERAERPEKPSGAEEDKNWSELMGLVENLADEHVRDLIKMFVFDDDIAQRLRKAPAAKSVHHAYQGGLLEHTVACMKLAHRISDQYPQVDRDLLVAGAFFHDLGKIRELSFGGGGTDYTDEGRLVGHHVMTAQWIHDKARRAGVPRELETHVVHLVLAHHGKLEYGSPKIPATLEALLTHYVDELDSRVNSWLNLMARDSGSKRWTDSNNIYEQHIWRGALPTVQAEKKSPPAELMTPTIYVPRQHRQQPRKPKPPRPAREDRGEAREAREPRPEGERPPRVERASAGDRPEGEKREAKPAGFGGERAGWRQPGDKKKGYQGPRLPGDRGPQRRPGGEKPKALTHNPFAALAEKLPEGEKPAEPAEHAAEAAETPTTGAPNVPEAAASENPPAEQSAAPGGPSEQQS